MMLYLLVSSVLVGACALLAIKILAFVREERIEQQRRIIATYAMGDTTRATGSGRIPSSQETKRPSKDVPFSAAISAAGVEMPPGLWLGCAVGTSVLAGVLVTMLSGWAVWGVVVAVLVLAGLAVWVKQRIRKRQNLFDEQLAHALPRIAASLKGSLTLERALRVALVHMDDPLRKEFAHVLADASYGMPLHEALEAMAQRTQNEDVKTLAAASRVRQSSGGSIASALSMISTRVNARLKAARELKVEVAGTRMAKWFVAGSMPVIFFIMYATNADFAQFYTTEPLGWVVLGVAVVMEVVGLVAARAVTSLDGV